MFSHLTAHSIGTISGIMAVTIMVTIVTLVILAIAVRPQAEFKLTPYGVVLVALVRSWLRLESVYYKMDQGPFSEVAP